MCSTTECLRRFSGHQCDSLTLTRLVSFKLADGIVYNIHLHAGRVLNRFSKDVGFLDKLLPFVLCDDILVRSKHTRPIVAIIYVLAMS